MEGEVQTTLDAKEEIFNELNQSKMDLVKLNTELMGLMAQQQVSQTDQKDLELKLKE